MTGFLSRGPDARLQKARKLAKAWATQDSLECYDQQIVDYAKYVHELAQLQGVEQERHAARNEVLAQVHYLAGACVGQGFIARDPHKQNTDHMKILAQRDTALVKAMVVCNAEPEGIATDMGFMTSAIEMFEYLAWDVRPHLTERGYMHNVVLNNTALGAVHAENFEQLVLMEAYENGIDGVRCYLGLDRRGEKTIEEMDLQKNIALSAKAKTAVRALRPDNHNSIELLRLQGQLESERTNREIRRIAAKAGGSSGKLDEKAQRDLVDQISGIGLSVANVGVESNEEENSAIEGRVLVDFEEELMKELARRQEEAEDASKANV